MLEDREVAFVEQSVQFLELARELYPNAASLSLHQLTTSPVTAVVPTVLTGRLFGPAEIAEVVTGYRSTGVAYFLFDPPRTGAGEHYLIEVARQLADQLPTAHAVDHPMESHPQALTRFGPPDGTLKLYDLPMPAGVDKYREQAETNQMFDAHNDGLGYGGRIATILMGLDRPPLWGGFTYFTNLLPLALALANDDYAAFQALFLPNAITALRPRGKGAIRVTTPILYVNDAGRPQTFYRRASGEYQISVRPDCAPLDRALAVLDQCTAPFGPSSSLVHFTRPGEGVLVQNEHVVHGRTDFLNGAGTERVLARKWFTRVADDAIYRHVPGMNVAPEYAALFPELFDRSLQVGEWHYDTALGRNVPATQ